MWMSEPAGPMAGTTRKERTMSFTTDYTEILEALLSQAIVDGETAVADGRYRLSLADRTAWLYEDNVLVHRTDLDSDMLGEQDDEFLQAAGLC